MGYGDGDEPTALNQRHRNKAVLLASSPTAVDENCECQPTCQTFLMPTRTALSTVALSAAIFAAAGCNNASRDSNTKEGASSTATTQPTPSGSAHDVQVVGLDYAFSMPDSLDAGRTSFSFTNKGKVDHEYNVVLLKQGVSLQQYIDALNKAQPTSMLRDGTVGVLFASPGKTSASVLSADLLPGRTYAIQCINIDSANAPTHRELGMFKSFSVRAATVGVPAIAALAVDTVVGTDYAYTQYPKTLTPGWHHFMFVNAGKQHHEIKVAMLNEGVTLKQALDVAGKGGNVASVIDESLGVLHSDAGTSPLGTLNFEVQPGREYILVCTFSDTPKSPPHFALGMVTSMMASK